MNKIQFQVYPNDANTLPWRCTRSLLPHWQLYTGGLCPFQIWLIKEKNLVSNLMGDLRAKFGIKERVVTFTYYVTDFSIWIHTKPADHTVQERSRAPDGGSCHTWAEVAYVGKALVLLSALLSALLLLSFIILYLSFPLAKHQLSGRSPAWEGKPMARSCGRGALGPPQGAPRCLLTRELEIWVGFLWDEASQHRCPILSVTSDR